MCIFKAHIRINCLDRKQIITWVKFSVQNFGTLLLYHQIKAMLLVFLLCLFFPQLRWSSLICWIYNFGSLKLLSLEDQLGKSVCWLCKNYVLSWYLLPVWEMINYLCQLESCCWVVTLPFLGMKVELWNSRQWLSVAHLSNH